jgi:3-deoxy-D-manno-octulosonic-acid transferase
VSAARAAYTALLYLLAPFAVLRLGWRARRERGYSRHVAERFGLYAGRAPAGPLIWLHAVSLGETRAAEPLVRALQKRYPGHRVLLTHMTPTGRSAGEALFGEAVLRAYLPYDFPGAVSRFLDRFRPDIGLLMETEVWPNLVQACRRRGVPLVLVNARLSEKSQRGYSRFGALTREAFGALAGVAAQSEDDARRLARLGASNVRVTGNVKFDAAPAQPLVALGQSWKAGFGPRAVLLAASTREGEEPLVLDAWAALAPAPLLVIDPRHPQRFDEVAGLLERRGLCYVRRSAGMQVSGETQVVLGDSVGEMPAYYAACDVAFIGGSLLPYGAHNFIEASAVGKPVLLGPHTYNFAEAAARAIEAGAASSVDDVQALTSAAAALLADDAARERMSERALEFSRAYQGATDQIVEMVGEFMSGRPPSRPSARG